MTEQCFSNFLAGRLAPKNQQLPVEGVKKTSIISKLGTQWLPNSLDVH